MSRRPDPDLEPVHVWLKPVDSDQRSAAHALLVELAGTLLDHTPVLRHDAAGRPHVDPLWVSISHTGQLVAVAAGFHGPVGVDVETQQSREVTALARRWFHPEELAWMTAQPDELAAFLHLWTAKEAVGKALGQGLRNAGLRRRMPLPDTIGSGLIGAVPGEAQLGVVHLPVRVGAVVAVALPVGTRGVEVCEVHGAALRSAVVSRTSFPVVVRGN